MFKQNIKPLKKINNISIQKQKTTMNTGSQE